MAERRRKQGRRAVGPSRLWQGSFDARTRQRGASYFEEGRVELLARGPHSLSATVRGAQPYRVGVAWGYEPDEVDFDCECPAFRRELQCKHVWAVLLQMEAEAVPVPAAQAGEGELFEDEEPDERSLTERWLERLEPYRREAGQEPWSRLRRPEARIGYRLLLDEARRGEVVIGLRRSWRRKDGSFGAEQAFAPSLEPQDEPIDPEDRRLIAALRGGLEAEAHYFMSHLGGAPAFVLEAELLEELLPRLAATGRLGWELGERKGGPLAWDPGPPWRLALRLEREGERVALVGELARGAERMELARPLALVEGGVLIEGGRVARFEPGAEMPLVAALRDAGRLELPAAREGELLAVATELGGRALGEVAGYRWRAAAMTPRLRVERAPASGRAAWLPFTVRFDYGGFRVDPDEPHEVLGIEGQRELLRRDLAAEQAALERLFSAARRTRADIEEGRHGALPAKRLPELVRALTAEGWQVEADGRVWRAATATRARLKSAVDWFELEGGLAFGDQLAPFPRLLEAARKGEGQVLLDDGSVGMLPERWLERWGLVELARRTEGEALRFERHQGFLLDAFLAQREELEADAGFEDYRARLARFKGLTPADPPPSFVGVLRRYQREGLGWFGFLAEMGFGGCLADDMGLGKTVQVLALLEQRRTRALEGGEERRPSLVVAPRSLVFNWLDEAARFAPELRTLDYTGSDRGARRGRIEEADLVVTTYGTLRRDALELKDLAFDYLVLDEATAIKNAASQSAKAARLLRASHRLALSGTPVENHLGELWSLFEFLNPGMLGRSRAFQRFLAGGDGADLPALARALRPFFLRRTKEEVLDDLPEKTEQPIVVELSRRDRKRYDELREHYRAALLGGKGDGGFEPMRIQVLEALLRLRQCACHPGLIDASLAGESSAKLDALLPLLEEIAAEGSKALVFSQFTSFLDLVRQRLDGLGLAYESLDGRTRDRKRRVERFQGDPALPVFLISLKAGGHGLNLTAADYVFLLDPWWNPAAEAQAIDRAHRIGRTRPVFAYRLIARGTVEEKVLELQKTKRELAATLLGESKGVLRDLSREDLERLLS